MTISVAVCEIFSVTEWCNLENRVRVHSRHHLIDRIRVPIRLPSELWRYRVSFARYKKLLVENHEIFIPHVYLVPLTGWPRQNFTKMFDTHKMIKLEWLVKKQNYINMWNRFHRIAACDRRTDGQNCTSAYWCAIKMVNFIATNVFWYTWFSARFLHGDWAVFFFSYACHLP